MERWYSVRQLAAPPAHLPESRNLAQLSLLSNRSLDPIKLHDLWRWRISAFWRARSNIGPAAGGYIAWYAGTCSPIHDDKIEAMNYVTLIVPPTALYKHSTQRLHKLCRIEKLPQNAHKHVHPSIHSSIHGQQHPYTRTTREGNRSKPLMTNAICLAERMASERPRLARRIYR